LELVLSPHVLETVTMGRNQLPAVATKWQHMKTFMEAKFHRNTGNDHDLETFESIENIITDLVKKVLNFTVVQ
jgi:hypothetical protein